MSILSLTEQDELNMRAVTATAESNASYYTDISDSLVDAYSSDLDSLMNRIKADCIEVEPSDKVLESYTMELSNALYFVGQKLEAVGIKDDLSKMASKEIYNESYLSYLDNGDAKKKPTVAELTALAEADSKYQTVLNSIYSRVYRQIKYKVDAAYEMLSSIRKIISKRMQDNQLSMARQTGGVVIGREEF
jgi:hypothetical protein